MERLVEWDGIDPRDPGITLGGQGQSKPDYLWYSMYCKATMDTFTKGFWITPLQYLRAERDIRDAIKTKHVVSHFKQQPSYSRNFTLWEIIEAVMETHTWMKSDWPQNMILRIPTIWRCTLLTQWAEDLASQKPLVLKRNEPCLNIALRSPGVPLAWKSTWFPFFACSINVVDIRPPNQDPAIPKSMSVAVNDIVGEWTEVDVILESISLVRLKGKLGDLKIVEEVDQLQWTKPMYRGNVIKAITTKEELIEAIENNHHPNERAICIQSAKKPAAPAVAVAPSSIPIDDD